MRPFPRFLMPTVLLLLLIGTFMACGDESVVQPGEQEHTAQIWGSDSPGEAHNVILAAFQQQPETLDPTTRLRRAVWVWVENSPEPSEEFRKEVALTLSDPILARMGHSFCEWRKLITSRERSPQQIQEFLGSLEGVDSQTVAEISTFVEEALEDRPLSPPLKSGSNSESSVFLDVFSKSHDYWSQIQLAGKSKGEEIGLVLSDATGALGGLFAGPIGSIIGGALYSTFWIATGPSDSSGGCASCHN